MLGLGDGIIIYTREDQIVGDPDSEDLSSINSMFKSKKKSERALEQQEEDEQMKGSQSKNRPKDKESNCSIF